MKLKHTTWTNCKNIWIMSDLHYGHDNILRFQPNTRPYKDMSEMKTYIREEFEKKIHPEDALIDLGDFFMKTPEDECKSILNSLKTKQIYKVMGNHDNPNLNARLPWLGVYDIIDTSFMIDGVQYPVCFCHFPLLTWGRRSHGCFMIHGHCHGRLDEMNTASTELRLDVGFDSDFAKSTGSFLINFTDIIKKMSEITGGKSPIEYTSELGET